MTLEASYKTQLIVVTDGIDEKEAIQAIVDLFPGIKKKKSYLINVIF